MLEKKIYLLYHLSGDNMYRKIYKKLLSWKNTKEDNRKTNLSLKIKNRYSIK